MTFIRLLKIMKQLYAETAAELAALLPAILDKDIRKGIDSTS
jgi:hypothetical protein